MITSNECFARFGNPATNESRFMVLWEVPQIYRKGNIPSRIYCNKILIPALSRAFGNLIIQGCVNELKTFDGCFNIRTQRNSNIMSLHSWGVAIDLNANENRQGTRPRLSEEFVKCFTEAGFDWGGYWKGSSVDGMHFQISKL